MNVIPIWKRDAWTSWGTNFENFLHKEQILKNLIWVNTILCMKCMKPACRSINLPVMIKRLYHKEW